MLRLRPIFFHKNMTSPIILPKDFQYQYACRDYRVIDGDTIWTNLILGFDTFSEQNCRILSVDTPEKNTEAGKLVTQINDLWCKQNLPLYIVSVKRDKFAGRYDGIVWDREKRYTLNQYLLEQGLARAYAGEKKPKWLKRDLNAIADKARLILNHAG